MDVLGINNSLKALKQFPIFHNEKRKYQDKTDSIKVDYIDSAKNLVDKNMVAVKIQDKYQIYGNLEKEAYYLYLLKGFGIPKIISYGFSGNYNILIEELLGKSLEKLFQENATFKSEEFAKFIRMVFILTEEKYALTKLKNKKTNEPVYIISEFPARDFVLNELQTEKDLETFIKKSPEGTIILRGEETYPFKENAKMDEQFSKHKRLRLAIYDLIQLKLNNPYISDEERMKEELSFVLQTNLRNSYLSSTKKSQ